MQLHAYMIKILPVGWSLQEGNILHQMSPVLLQATKSWAVSSEWQRSCHLTVN